MNYLTAYTVEQTADDFPGLFSQTYNDGTQDWWLYLSSVELTGGKPIGVWNPDGTVAGPIDPDYAAYIRPFGNIEGFATDQLDFHHFQGHAQRAVQPDPVPDTAPEYPPDTQPIVLTFARRWDDTAGFEGWGWIATIEFADPNRPPNARAIGIYDSQWNYQYTTGAFVWTDTGEVDDQNQPIFKWQTINPAGRVTAAPEPIYYALLLGSAQEGRMSLESLAEDEQRTDFFWEFDQGVTGGQTGAGWVDSGETVTGMAGTVTLVSDVAPFPVGTQVRIEGVEMTVTSIWAGQGLVLDPYRASTTGAAIEVWQ
jgi:hypothetical protein